ncbi:hypothetical protein V5K00_RS22020 [Enterobacter asburiae]
MWQIESGKVKKSTFIVDADIHGLVAAMNVHGFRTYASCQGHGFPVDRIKPYVAFTSSQSEAARLACILREDAESSAPKLLWGWEVTASFNSVFRLCFRLHPAGPHHWWLRYCRSSLKKDFGNIGQMLISVCGKWNEEAGCTHSSNSG